MRERIERLSASRRALLELYVREPDLGRAFPVSQAQFGIWLFEQLSPGTSAYHNPAALRVSGELDETALRSALRAIADRHAPLRSRYADDADGTLWATVAPPGTEVPLRCVDVRDAERPAETALRLAERESAVPFDLARGPAWRMLWIRHAQASHLLVLTLHHIISDGTSLGIFFTELAASYQAARSGQAPALPALGRSYFDLIADREHGPGTARAQACLEYWRGQLASVPNGVTLDRLARILPGTETAGQAVPFCLSEQLTQRLVRLCTDHRATLFAGLAGLLAVLMHAHSGQRVVPLITPVDTRRADGATLIGCFTNNVVLRIDVEPTCEATELLTRAGAVMAGALAHSEAPFASVARVAGLRRRGHGDPFGNLAIVHNNAPSGVARWAELTMTRQALPVTSAKYDLALHIGRESGGVRGNLEHSARFTSATARALADDLVTMATALTDDPSLKVSELAAMTRPGR